jgi:collagenase-like PrtC family protease
MCRGGICVPPPSACGRNEVLCGGGCLHASVLMRDDGNCGECGNACPDGYHCRGGVCRDRSEQLPPD